MPKITLICFVAVSLIWGGCNKHSKPDHADESRADHAVQGKTSAACDGHDHEEPSEREHAEHEGETHTEAGTSVLVVFSKKLQQEFGIKTKLVERRPIHRTIRAMGEIKPAGTREAEVVAPFAGILMPDVERGIVRPGEQVKKGEHLAILAPSTGENGWFQLLSEYRLAKAEVDRVQELAKTGAVAPRRVQETELSFNQIATRLAAALGGTDPARLDSGDMTYHLTAPASGILADVHLRYGQYVEMGERLFNIVDPSRVWLEIQVPISESQHLEKVKDAYFTIGGYATIYRTADLNGQLITVGGLVDPATRRVPVIFELDNPNNRFKPGSFAQAYLREGADREVLAIPQSALLDEDGIPVAMQQLHEEDFRKVVLKTGARDEDYIEVLSGLNEGSRVVVEGAYKVKLGANQPTADAHAGHGH